jgi:hypothetical protein
VPTACVVREARSSNCSDCRMNTLLHQEVENRFCALPDAQRIDPFIDLMRIAVQVTRELMQKRPESIDEFLSTFPVPPRTH